MSSIYFTFRSTISETTKYVTKDKKRVLITNIYKKCFFCNYRLFNIWNVTICNFVELPNLLGSYFSKIVKASFLVIRNKKAVSLPLLYIHLETISAF